MMFRIQQTDCFAWLRECPALSLHAVCTDPPYGLGFMGHEWDHGVPGPLFWENFLRVCKPGAMMLAFGGKGACRRK